MCPKAGKKTTNKSESSAGTQLKLQTREMVHKLNNMLFVINGYSGFIRETHMDEDTLANVKHIKIASSQTLWEPTGKSITP